MAMAVASTVCEESLIINNSKARKVLSKFWEEFRNVGGNFVNEL